MTTNPRAACIVFLDFDGVTHPEPCSDGQLFANLPQIEDVLRRFDSCKVVISSSWRTVHPLEEMREYFAADIQTRVIGVTPELESSMGKGKDLSPRYDRQHECEMWLRNKQVWLPQNRRANVPWIALDDRSYLFRPSCKNLLQVEGKWGFGPADALRLESMLTERCGDQQ